MCVYEVIHMSSVPVEARGGCQKSWSLSYRWLWVTLHGFKEPDSGLRQEQCVPNYWAIPAAPQVIEFENQKPLKPTMF